MTARIIIIEDEPLVALEIEQAVAEAGCRVAATAYTLDQAFAVIEAEPCDGVIVDANLSGDSAEPFVERLKARGIPYILVSGYGRDQLGFVEDDAPLVGKPFLVGVLAAAIRDRFGSPGE